jgi:serine/threonine protein kinase
LLGTTIAGKYRIVRLLGEGGMGAVYEAEHTTTRRRLAVKVITLNDHQKKTEVMTRFEREARVAGALDTEHIVQVIDSGEDAAVGKPFMVMELLQGEDLDSLTERQGPLAPEVALRIAAQACVGLRHAHQAGIIHRDIKPANLFLAQRDEGRVLVKILDFGIAKVSLDEGLSGEAGKLTRTGSMIGSPYFMSPEQALGEKDVDFRSDIWSLGVVLYAMLTGRTPHEDVESLGQIIMRICSKPADPVQDLAPWVSAEAAAVVHRALKLDRNQRFGGASEMLDALRALLPRGMEITRDMLGPVPDEVRASVAPRLSSEDMGIVAPAPSPSAPALAHTGPISRKSASDTMSTSSISGVTPVPAARSKKPVIVVVAAAAIGAFAAVGYGVTRPPAPGTAPSADPSVAEPVRSQAGPVVLPVPGGTVTSERTVMLTIAPGSADVDVDGKRVNAKDGKVELAGALGSVHKVRVTVGPQFEERDVVIADSGPIPPKIEVLPKAASASAKPSGTPGPTAPGPLPAKTSKPKTASTVDKNFDQ